MGSGLPSTIVLPSLKSEQMSKDHQIVAKQHVIGKTKAKNKETKEQFRREIMPKKENIIA